MASYPATPPYQERESSVGLKLLALFLGIAVAVMAVVGIVLLAATLDARKDARQAAKTAAAARSTATTMPAAAGAAVATPSFAGAAPANADALAAAHVAYPAELPALQSGSVVNVHLGIADRVVSIAPGVKYDAWSFGSTVPGPVVHVRQGQTVRITLTNNAPMAHSVDFHAARIAPNVAFADVLPGKSFTFSFQANDPGVYMYHCGTKPVLMHIANGMYGAIVVEPKAGLPRVDKQYVLVSGEWYLNSNGLAKPAQLDLVKADHATPDWVTWNGYAGQYVKHPLTAMPGETVRFWVVDAGPSLNTEFHIVGTILNRAWINADLIDAPQHGIQTAVVPAGGGGVFDVKIDKPGLYPFVSHAFASANLGEVGLLNVGNTPGTMSH